ncbi:Protein Star [Folsomia candida]|uniref:Protein Star n=1 Tax=Folsomia candida TaxID=158441 RepID=A0A226EZ99_FOLCA|nr:Protein Star [Folsomia candida]
MKCRAFEGDLLSKTLDLELYYNWTGILMEPDPTLFPKLIAKRRNAWLLNACLSPDPTPHNLDFLRKISKSSMNNSSQSDQDAMMPDRKSTYRDGKGHVWRKLRIPCFPLFSVTSALQVYTIDYLILDAQGLELQILLNIPWNDLKIHVILVNVQSIPEGPSGVKFFMHSKGFTLISSTGHFYMFANENFNP